MLGGQKMVCRWCGKGPLEQRGHKPRLFCNNSCRNRAWQQQQKEKLRQAARLIQEVLKSDE